MSARTVAMLRHLVRITIRLFAFVALALVLSYVFTHVRQLLSPDAGYWQTFRSKPVWYVRQVIVGSPYPLLALAAVFWLLQNQIARWIVPLAPRTCGECGYDLRQLKSNRCPECGAEVVDANPRAGKT